MTSPLRHVRRLARSVAHRPDVQALLELDEVDTREQVLKGLRAKNPTVRVPLTQARVAVAGDSSTTRSLAREWAQTALAAETWRADLTAEHELLVAEVDGGMVVGWAEPVAAVELAEVARELGIPSAAWVTGQGAPEANLAEAFDVVFVADAESAVDGTQVLPPAAQVRRHSPVHAPGAQRGGDILVRDEPSAPLHAGDEEAVTALLTALEDTPLHAHRWGLGEEGAPHPHAKLAAQYDVLVDLGRRAPAATWPVLDALASRTAVVTTQERAARLPEDLQQVVAVAEPHEVRRNASVLALQPEFRDRRTHLAHRAVLAGHTLTDRARTMLDVAGIAPPVADRTVSVVVPTNRLHELTNVLENVARQERVDAELIIVAHGIDVDGPELRAQAADLGVDQLTVVPAGADLTLGAVLNLGLDVASGAYIAKMDDDNFYGPQFLADLVDAFSFTSAGITGKWAHYVWLRSTNAVVLRFENYEHTYNRLVQGGSIVAKAEVAQDIRFSNIPRAVDSDFLNRAMAAGVQTYSGDRYNFISVRGDDRLSHTWKIDDLVFMSGAGRVVTYGDPRELVTV